MNQPYHKWIAEQRAAALLRGGKPVRPARKHNPMNSIPPQLQEALSNRSDGEIINPITGEVMTDCLTVQRFAEELGTTTRALQDQLKVFGILHEVLGWKHVPMVSAPELRKPEYFHRARLSPWAIQEAIGISITTTTLQGRLFERDLLTPDGQRYIAARLAKPAKPVRTFERVREIVQEEPQVSVRDIARQLGVTRQSVQKHLRNIPTWRGGQPTRSVRI